jgi:hypothetical protein
VEPTAGRLSVAKNPTSGRAYSSGNFRINLPDGV